MKDRMNITHIHTRVRIEYTIIIDIVQLLTKYSGYNFSRILCVIACTQYVFTYVKIINESHAHFGDTYKFPRFYLNR